MMSSLPSKTLNLELGFQIEEVGIKGFHAKEKALVHGKNGQDGPIRLPGVLRAFNSIPEKVQ